MRLLLDSHAVIWYVDQDHLLSADAHRAITEPSNDLLLSAATVWEIAIKVGRSKLSLSMPYDQSLVLTLSSTGTVFHAFGDARRQA